MPPPIEAELSDLSSPTKRKSKPMNQTIDASAHRPQPVSGPVATAFVACGGLRQLALFAIAAMGLWPLFLQAVIVPQSVFGDGHGDRYEQVSYYARETDHYQVLLPRKVECRDLQKALFGSATPTVTTDLLRAVPNDAFTAARAVVVNQTTGDAATVLSVSTAILSLSKDRSLCFGGVDDEGSVQIEALVSAQDAAWTGVDASCIQGRATHLRLRLQSTEFFSPDTMGELNPARIPGAMLIVSLVDESLMPVMSTCFDTTRKDRYAATQSRLDYIRLVSVYSTRLLVSEKCDSFNLFGGSRDTFGCAYSAIGASGATANLLADGPQRQYSYPAPWRMIQCTVAGECSSLLFTQLWLSEWTVQDTAAGQALRHNFINHKVNEVTVDGTFSLRLLISMQILALVVTAYLTSVRGWYSIHSAIVSPWSKFANATTSCTIAKVVRSSYNFILAAQLLVGIFQWRKQLTVDLLVGADTRQAVLRATGCGTLVVVLSINILFARAGDLKMQEMEPSFAHVVGFVASLILYLLTWSDSIAASVRTMLASGMHTLAAAEVTKFSGCRGSFVCAAQASLQNYSLMLLIIIGVAAMTGWVIQTMLQAITRDENILRELHKQNSKSGLVRKESLNSFTRFLDDRSQSTDMYDSSTEIYVRLPGGNVLSTRGQLEACGFVPATTMLFRYRDLPQFLAARVLPKRVLDMFNLTVTIFELMDTGDIVNDLPVVYVADQVIHAHWSKLKGATLSWSAAYYGGEDRDQRFSSGLAQVFRPSRGSKYAVAADSGAH